MSGGRVLISLGAIGKDLPPLTHNMRLRAGFNKGSQIWPLAGIRACGLHPGILRKDARLRALKGV